jgi:hypothetical protein
MGRAWSRDCDFSVFAAGLVIGLGNQKSCVFGYTMTDGLLVLWYGTWLVVFILAS